MSSETFALITSCPLQPFCAGRTCGHYKAEFFLWHFPEAPLMCHCNAFSSQCPKIEPSGLPSKSKKPTILSVMLRHHCEGTFTTNHLQSSPALARPAGTPPHVVLQSLPAVASEILTRFLINRTSSEIQTGTLSG